MRSPPIAVGGASPGPPGRVPRLLTDRRRATWLALGALVLAAWAALAALTASPYARYVLHDGWTSSPIVAELCAAVPAGGLVVPALLHALAWTLMIAAMMLPTTFPLLAMFARVVGERPDAPALTARVVAGYAAAWLAFGLVAHAADGALHALARASPWLGVHGWAVGAAVLAGAGLFQFSAMKYRCLDRCRTPLGFVVSRWHGRSPGVEAFRLGIDHGLFCVGCCAALMLVMFVVGAGSLFWMLAIGLAMAAEKNLPFGKRLRTPLGVGLLGAAALVVVSNV